MASLRVPYMSRLEGGGLQPGQTVVIKGMQTSGNFNVLFLTGQNPDTADACLSFVVNVKDKKVILNDKTRGVYGKEEKKSDPFKEGQNVDIRIRCHDSKFEIYTNLKHLCDFDYRQPLNTINHLYIDGGIELTEVSWGGKYYPVPYQAGVDGGFTVGKRLIVSGVPEKSAKLFSINLMTEKNEYAFHFNVQFSKKVARNSNIGGSWAQEENDGKFPFSHDEVFDVMVVNEAYSLQVFVNGNHFCSFSHRTDPKNYRGISVNADVILMGVHVK